jgi:hypothetical protein
MERQLRKTKEKAIERGKWAGRGGPKGSFRVSDQLPSGYDSDMEFPKDRKVCACNPDRLAQPRPPDCRMPEHNLYLSTHLDYVKV